MREKNPTVGKIIIAIEEQPVKFRKRPVQRQHWKNDRL